MRRRLTGTQRPLPIAGLLEGSRLPLSAKSCAALRKLRGAFQEHTGSEMLRAELLFRGSQKGEGGPSLSRSRDPSPFQMKRCHREVDQRGPTLLLIRTTEGSVCGGYAAGSWDSQWTRWINAGGHSFLFSLEGPGHGVEVGVAYTCTNPERELLEREGCLGFGEDLTVVNSCNRVCVPAKFGTVYGALQGVVEGRDFLMAEGAKFRVAELEVWALLAEGASVAPRQEVASHQMYPPGFRAEFPEVFK